MLRVTTRFTGVQGTPWYSNQYFIGSTQEQAVAAQDAVFEFWSDLAGHMPTAVTGEVQPEVDLVDPATGNVTQTFVVPQQNVDFAGGAALPWAVQGLVRLRTGDFIAGREVRGRIYIPAPTAENNSNGVPSASYVTLLQTAATALLSAATAGGGLCVYSRTHNSFHEVSTVSAWNQFAELRTRRD
jgi:hypothetical protein